MSETLIEVVSSANEGIVGRAESDGAAMMARVLSAVSVDCPAKPETGNWSMLVAECDIALAQLVLAKRKKNVEDEDEMDDEEEEEDDLDEEDDEVEDFDDEDEDDFDEEFDDDDLDDDDDDIFYDDDDDE